ncbi:MAG TPA: class I SAM-dependent methyltransferase [Usitatibacter sp.]|nr:class I SAM-dependent methyltransferase [Usitatibacter sp.]
MNAEARELVTDELDLMRAMLPLAGARVVDLGCGNAQMSRRMLREAGASSVAALEVDRVQFEKNVAEPPMPALTLRMAGAEAIPFPDASFDIATMFKSLHHVPVETMDAALREIRRVLAPGGLLYVSEPVFAGEFNEVVRLFHDEERVRAAAIAAMRRAEEAGVLQAVEVRCFDMPLAFRDFDDFDARIIRVTHTQHSLDARTLADVRRRFEAHMGAGGARFVRPMRVNLMKRGV